MGCSINKTSTLQWRCISRSAYRSDDTMSGVLGMNSTRIDLSQPRRYRCPSDPTPRTASSSDRHLAAAFFQHQLHARARTRDAAVHAVPAGLSDACQETRLPSRRGHGTGNGRRSRPEPSAPRTGFALYRVHAARRPPGAIGSAGRTADTRQHDGRSCGITGRPGQLPASRGGRARPTVPPAAPHRSKVLSIQLTIVGTSRM